MENGNSKQCVIKQELTPTIDSDWVTICLEIDNLWFPLTIINNTEFVD